jgi:hypothetical protein
MSDPTNRGRRKSSGNPDDYRRKSSMQDQPTHRDAQRQEFLSRFGQITADLGELARECRRAGFPQFHEYARHTAGLLREAITLGETLRIEREVDRRLAARETKEAE